MIFMFFQDTKYLDQKERTTECKLALIQDLNKEKIQTDTRIRQENYIHNGMCSINQLTW